MALKFLLGQTVFKFVDQNKMLFASITPELFGLSGVARAFPGGQLAHPEDQNEEKIKENERNLKKKWGRIEEMISSCPPGAAGFGPALPTKIFMLFLKNAQKQYWYGIKSMFFLLFFFSLLLHKRRNKNIKITYCYFFVCWIIWKHISYFIYWHIKSRLFLSTYSGSGSSFKTGPSIISGINAYCTNLFSHSEVEDLKKTPFVDSSNTSSSIPGHLKQDCFRQRLDASVMSVGE